MHIVAGPPGTIGGLPVSGVAGFALDSAGRVWISTMNGLGVVEGQSGGAFKYPATEIRNSYSLRTTIFYVLDTSLNFATEKSCHSESCQRLLRKRLQRSSKVEL